VHLIIQAHDIETQDLKTLHGLAQAKAIEKIEGAFSHQAFRITDADVSQRDVVQAYCERAKLDSAFIAPHQSLADFKLIAMDMDSTLITIECIDEIADYAGKKAEVAAVTEAAMRGEIDWPTSLRQRVAALAGLPESVLLRVYEDRLKLSPGAETLIREAKKIGIKLLLVSGGFTFFTEKLKARLQIDYAFSNTLEIIDGKLTGRVLGALCDADAKASHTINTYALNTKAPNAYAPNSPKLGEFGAHQILAIGDGANDLKMMAAAGTSIAYHAKPVVRAQASFAMFTPILLESNESR
jgi:phosphoserine phosphatase